MRLRAPEVLRKRLRGLSTKELVRVASRFRLADGPRDVPTATKFALRSVARRYVALSEEIEELETHLKVGWWGKRPLSWSPCLASVPTAPPPS